MLIFLREGEAIERNRRKLDALTARIAQADGDDFKKYLSSLDG